MAKSEVDYQLKCNYSDIVFDEWKECSAGRKRNGGFVEIGRGARLLEKPLERLGEIIQSELRVRFIEYRNNITSGSSFEVSAIFPDGQVHFESEDELNDYISKRLIDFCLGTVDEEWQRVK
jgi:hypothetical protein